MRESSKSGTRARLAVASPAQWAEVETAVRELVRALRRVYLESADPELRALADSMERLRVAAETRARGGAG